MHELHDFAKTVAEQMESGQRPVRVSRLPFDELRSEYAALICDVPDHRIPEPPPWESRWLTCTIEEFEMEFLLALKEVTDNFNFPSIIFPEDVVISTIPAPATELTVNDDPRLLSQSERTILSVMSFTEPLSAKEIASATKLASQQNPAITEISYANVNKLFSKGHPLRDCGYIAGGLKSGYFRVK